MSSKKNKITFRVIHRYLGFFLTGIMAMYAISGTVLIFRETDAFQVEKHIQKDVEPNIPKEGLGKKLGIRRLEVTNEKDGVMYFAQGTYDSKTGKADYKLTELPWLLKKMTHLHKATTDDPTFFLNIFFACSLLFFVVSAFWMYTPKTSVFKKGMIFVGVGFLLALVLILI